MSSPVTRVPATEEAETLKPLPIEIGITRCAPALMMRTVPSAPAAPTPRAMVPCGLRLTTSMKETVFPSEATSSVHPGATLEELKTLLICVMGLLGGLAPHVTVEPIKTIPSTNINLFMFKT